MDSRRAAFVAEAEEGITDLNNALLALEADPSDAGAMDDVFRTAHTLKGNAAAMGYDDVSSLAHALEDLLDEVRDGDREVTPDLMDLLFEGVDTVEAMIAEISEEGEVSTDPSAIESRLRDLEGTDATVAEVTSGGASGSTQADDTAEGAGSNGGNGASDSPAGSIPAAAADLDADPSELHRASIRVGETAMPGVDATFVLEHLAEEVDSFATDPDRERLEDGDYGDGFDAYLPAPDPAATAAELEGLPQVESVETTPLSEVGDSETGPADGDGEATEDRRDDEEATDEEATDDVPGSNDAPEGDDADDAGETGGDDAGEGGDDGDVEDEEDDSDASSPGPSTDSGEEISTIRVDVDQVDELYGLVEQLVTSRIKLRRELQTAGIESDALDELDKLANSLQDTAMDMRLVPFSQIADSFPRLVRDVARDLDKQVAFDVEGGDVELDRTILTEMRDPLVHVLRNAVDHGIEPPEEREAAGKDPTGRVELTATRNRDHVVIEVTDDGGGIDPDGIAEKAIEEGVITREDAGSMDEEELYDLVFHPGLTTAEEVTGVSGRGVGMDVVRTTARSLDGSVSVDSEPGEGTTIRFRLPVTVAIVKVMFVRVGEAEYGIPIKSIAEVARADDVAEVHGEEVVRHDDDLYPVIRLADRLGERPLVSAENAAGATTDGGTVGGDDGTTPAGDAGQSTDGMLVRIREETRQVALHCDEVLDQEEIVVKPLEGPLSGTPGISGTAVLGDGDVVAVLDVMSL